MMEGYKAIPVLLERAGLHTVFALIGGSNAPWLAHGVESGSLRLVRARHEETAIHAAAGFGRSTGGIGVCSVTRGPGFTNGLNAMTVSTRGHVPILMMTGESPPSKKVTPQIVDQRALAKAIGFGFELVSEPAELESAFWTCIESILWNGSPHVLSLADGILEAEVSVSGTWASPTPPNPDPDAVVASVDALMEAKRPLILVGAGVVQSDCRPQVEELADLVGAHVATTLMMNRYFSGYEYDLGVCGTWSSQPVADEIATKDVVLSIGASLNRFTSASGAFFANSKIIQCEIDENQPFKSSSPDLALLGDAGATVEALLQEARSRRGVEPSARPPVPSREEIRNSIMKLDLGHDPDRGIDVRDVYVELDRKLPPDRIVVTDHGRFQGSLISLVDARDGQSYIVPISYSSIGTGLGHGIGAAVAHPDRPVVVFAGDGGFMMSSQDLDAIRLNQLDITIVIVNDEMYGSDSKFLVPLDLPFETITQTLPDIPTLARAFGGKGYVIRTLAELADLDLEYKGLTLIDVRIDPAVTGTPF